MAKKTYRRYKVKKKSPGRRLASFTSPAIKLPTKRAVSDAVTANPLPQHTYESKRQRVKVGPNGDTGPTEVPNTSGWGWGNKMTKAAGLVAAMTADELDRRIESGKYVLKGNFSSKIIVRRSDNMPPPPINLQYEVDQVGNPRQLNEFKKMYPVNRFEISTPHLTVGGGGTNFSRHLQQTTGSGFGRANVHWPYAMSDFYSDNEDCRTSATSCFNRTQLLGFFKKLYDQAYGSTPSVSFNDFMKKIENIEGGDQDYAFPIDNVECEYTYLNRNVALPMHVRIYLCMPKKPLSARHSPMYDWFNPFEKEVNLASLKGNLRMDYQYRYNPIVTASQNVLKDSSGNITVKANKEHISTFSTEVVPESTPQGFSTQFKLNWDVRHVIKLRLLPQQEVKLRLKVNLKKLLSVKQHLTRQDEFGLKTQSFPDLTIFPMVKYWGEETAGQSKGLVKDGTIDQNLILTSTAPRCGPCLLSADMKCQMTAHPKSPPLRGSDALETGAAFSLDHIMDNFTAKQRTLFTYNDLERGEQHPYHQVNDHIGYFCNKQSPSTTSTEVTQLAELDTHLASINYQSDPTPSQVKFGNSQTDWDYVQVETTSKASTVETGADISAKG